MSLHKITYQHRNEAFDDAQSRMTKLRALVECWSASMERSGRETNDLQINSGGLSAALWALSDALDIDHALNIYSRGQDAAPRPGLTVVE